MNWKKFIACVLVGFGLVGGWFSIPAYGAMTQSLDSRPTSYWWTGNLPKDFALIAAREVETIIEARTLELGYLTMTEGAILSNETANKVQFEENSEKLIIEFAATEFLLSSGTGPVKLNLGVLYLEFGEVSAPSAAATDTGYLYAANDGGATKLYFRSPTATTDLISAASGNTLDEAYDEGGGGVGKKVDVDTGGIEFEVDDNKGTSTYALLLDYDDVTNNNPVLMIENAGSGNSIDIEGTSGNDIEGSGDTWSVTTAGAASFASVSGAGSFTTLASTGITGLGNGTATVAVNSSVWDITTAGAGSGFTTFAITDDFSLADGKSIKGTAVSAETWSLQVYDNDTGPAYKDAILFTNGNTPAILIGDNNPTVAVNSADWDISTTGAMTGIGAITMDGLLTAAAGGALDGNWTVADEIVATLATDGEEWLISATATDFTADVAILTITTAAQDNNVYALRLRATPNADANNKFLVIEDNAGATDLLDIIAGGTTTWTLDPASYVKIDGDTTASTTTGGVLDIDVQSATATNKAVTITYQLEESASTAFGLYMDLNDDTTGAGEAYTHIYLDNSATGSVDSVKGVVFTNAMDTAIEATMGAAGKALVVDATTTDHTGATGVIDIGFDSKTDNSEAINILATFLTGGTGQAVAAMEIELVNDSGNASDILYGLIINVTDSTATGKEKGIYIKGTGIDAALQADFGYIRIGTGGTPTITPGDDDLYVEGSIEGDGPVQFDNIMVSIPDEITAASGAGTAASITTTNTEVATNGDQDLDVVTLANGVTGQIKHIYCTVEGNVNDTWKITPATMCGGTQITFAGVGEGCTLIYADSEGWVVVANNGGTIS